jgi:predicted dienelactone hydrolase
VRDPRIKSIVVAVPAVGVLFTGDDGSEVTVPIQLWRAERDRVSPNEWNSDVVERVFSTLTETHTVSRADHYVFLPPCRAALAQQIPEICRDAAGVNRASTHETFNRSISTFFSRTLRQ